MYSSQWVWTLKIWYQAPYFYFPSKYPSREVVGRMTQIMSLTIIPQISQLLETLTPDVWIIKTILQVVFLSLIHFTPFSPQKNRYKIILKHIFFFCHSTLAFHICHLGGNALQYSSYYKSGIKSVRGMSLSFLWCSHTFAGLLSSLCQTSIF